MDRIVRDAREINLVHLNNAPCYEHKACPAGQGRHAEGTDKTNTVCKDCEHYDSQWLLTWVSTNPRFYSKDNTDDMCWELAPNN